MSEQGVITSRKLYVGGYDLSGDFNALALKKGLEPQDNTRFGQTQKTAIPGLLMTQLEASGLWDADGSAQPDDVIPGVVQVAGNVITVGLQAGAAGEACEFFRAAGGNYRRYGNIGDILKFDLSAFLTNEQSIPGTILFNGVLVSTSNGTAFQVGAVPSGKSLYAAVHVLSLTPVTSITVKIQSDNASNFPSAANQITLTATQVGAQWATPVAGPITDDWWRITCTDLTGTPSVGLVIVMGIF